MKGWLGDTVRMGWALGYWNARKAFFVARGRRGRCPCHHPSDSGRPFETGCEAVLSWNQPARFRTVCPLLAPGPKGGWVCSVGPEKVRPFWGRAAGLAAGGLAVALVVTAGLGYGSMRVIGYHVTLRQVAWPPAWHELRGARADLFVRKARAYYESGRAREALSALRTAHEIAPEELGVSLPLAEVAETTSPEVADGLYFDMIRRHPERRQQIAQIWLHGLLTHARLREAAELAARQLPLDSAGSAAWTNVLVFAARLLGHPEVLESAAAQPGVPAGAAAVLRFEAQVRRTAPAAVPALLLGTPLGADYPYAIEQRVSLLIEFGRAREALGVLGQANAVLSGRDIARLALAAYAALGDRGRLKQQVVDLLRSDAGTLSAKITLVAEHLVVHPDADVLAEVVATLGDGDALPVAERRDVWLAILCAAGASGDRRTFNALEAKSVAVLSPTGLEALTGYYFPPFGTVVRGALPPLEIGSMNLAYALMERASRLATEKR